MSQIFYEERPIIDAKKHWEVIDKITYADGKEEIRTYHNLVVDDCSRLIASLMKRHAGHTGLNYWAVGSGNAGWSNQTPPSPTANTVKLVSETFRKLIPTDAVVFLDTNNLVTANITNRIQITLTFEEAEANGELREFGLFGGNASGTKDSGIMVNHKIHPLIYKTTDMRLERIIRITF